MHPIQFTPLEAVLMGMLISLLTGVVMRWLTTRSFVTCEDCEARHQGVLNSMKELRTQREQDLKDVKETNKTIFRMLRGLIVYSDIPQDKKEEILNDREAGK